MKFNGRWRTSEKNMSAGATVLGANIRGFVRGARVGEWGQLCLGGIFRHLPYPHPFTDQGKIRKNVKARVFAMPASNTKLTLDCVTFVKRN